MSRLGLYYGIMEVCELGVDSWWMVVGVLDGYAVGV